MYVIPEQDFSDGFQDLCLAAMNHIVSISDPNVIRWIKSSFQPPFMEHFSFFYGNQAFFVIACDGAGDVKFPGNPELLELVANEWNGHACCMRMRLVEGAWLPECDGWGLIENHGIEVPSTFGENAVGYRFNRIHPPSLITDERMVMTDWEFHDFAIQAVRQLLSDEGYKIISWQTDPRVVPSIIFEGSDGIEWAIVEGWRYGKPKPKPPSNWKETEDHLERRTGSQRGHFAILGATNPDGDDQPLWRGDGLHLHWQGLAQP